MNISWSPLAIDRLAEAAEYIARDDVDAAERWVVKAFEVVERLSAMPESGRIVPEVNRREVREIIFGQYRIIYRIAAEEVIILTVRHGRRLLDPEEINGPTEGLSSTEEPAG